jgi:hypothetical protein
MNDGQDLVSQLADAARDAVLARRTAIEAGGAGNLHAITIELAPANRGQVTGVETHLSWKSVIRSATR